jgi:REP element-mobilizing transposase RayT
MIRGIERRKIFLNDRDRKDFVERLSKLLPKTETACYAWAFMSNHAHFLFRTGLIPLASIMRRPLPGMQSVLIIDTKGTGSSSRIGTNP